jgi:hypothetical protein
MPNLTDEEINELDLLQLKDADELKASLFEFTKEFWDIIITDEYVHNWHIEFMRDEIQLVVDKFVLEQHIAKR